MNREKIGMALGACALALAVALTAAVASLSAHPFEAQPVPVEGGSYTTVSPAELAAMLESKDFLFVNVHIPYEGEIAGTDLFLPYDEVEQRLADLPADRNARLVLYCRSGHMSGIAARALVRLGYSNVWELSGGMVAWEEAGFQVIGAGS
ncbi:MAG: rhodanese-like domain-containing protein [Chloroflexi bacterium]|nr:rhodanese-like domain-containing protein [Chloroflexota bacterium]